MKPMKPMGFKTYQGFNSQDVMLTNSQYNTLRQNTNKMLKGKDSPSSHVRGTDALLQYASMKRDAQLGRISDEEAEEFRTGVKQNVTQNTVSAIDKKRADKLESNLREAEKKIDELYAQSAYYENLLKRKIKVAGKTKRLMHDDISYEIADEISKAFNTVLAHKMTLYDRESLSELHKDIDDMIDSWTDERNDVMVTTVVEYEENNKRVITDSIKAAIRKYKITDMSLLERNSFYIIYDLVDSGITTSGIRSAIERRIKKLYHL